MGSTLKCKSKNLLLSSKFFPLRADPHEKGDKNENDRVPSPESILIYLTL